MKTYPKIINFVKVLDIVSNPYNINSLTLMCKLGIPELNENEVCNCPELLSINLVHPVLRHIGAIGRLRYISTPVHGSWYLEEMPANESI